MSATQATAVAEIDQRILLIRGQRVMLDSDIAALYGVSTKRLNEQVKRNRARFPDAFLFRLTLKELAILRSQFATLRLGHGEHRKYPPNAFTEHGALMLASVLNSPRAIELSVLVIQAFVQMRQFVQSHAEISSRINELEKRLGTHDAAIANLIKAIRQLASPPAKPSRPIGFTAPIE
jgi:phage regulator Rha-like protein